LSYLVSISFDIKNATSKNYDELYSKLDAIGLSKHLIADDGSKIKIPTTTTLAGIFEGNSIEEIRTYVTDEIKKVYHQLNLKGEIFVFVGSNWGWQKTVV